MNQIIEKNGFIHGEVGTPEILDRALSAAEVQQLYTGACDDFSSHGIDRTADRSVIGKSHI
jgi:hypothetical protein